MGNQQDISNKENKKDQSQARGKSQLLIKAYTWSRDSHDLFDYEGKNFSKKNIKTHRPGVITRNKDEIRMLKDNNKPLHEEEKEILRLTTQDGNFWINSCQEVDNREGINGDEMKDNLDNGLWLVVKSIKTNHNGGFQLNEGDYLKLGRIKFRVKEIQGSPSDFAEKPRQTEFDNDQSGDGSMVKSHDSIKMSPRGGSQTCRICLSESSGPGNPFFNPCRCSGTMKYVHIKCLQRWLKSKLHIKDSGQSISVYWKSLECELCKTGYSNTFQINGHQYDIVEIDRPNCAYLMLEVLSKEKNVARGVHIIKMENKTNIRLGRGHDSDIRITDISVSRCHAIIKLHKGKFYLEDNNSKFGTLINMKKSFPISGAFKNISLQAGRTLICVSIKKSKTIFPVCFSNNANVDSSNDEANSDEDDAETENVAPSRQSQNGNTNRNLDIAAHSGEINDDNHEAENEEDPPGLDDREDHHEQAEENENF